LNNYVRDLNMYKTPCLPQLIKLFFKNSNKNGKRKRLETDGVLHGSITRPKIPGWQAPRRLSHK